MSGSNETKKLLDDEEASGPYGSNEALSSPPVGKRPSSPPRNRLVVFLSTHRSSIPGYGMLKMLKGSSLYSLYVLFILLMVYLTNQLDRYTLPIVTTSAGYDLQYGDRYCFKNRQLPSKVFKEYDIYENITDICGDENYHEFNDTQFNDTTLDVKFSQTYCEDLEILQFPKEADNAFNKTLHVCEYNYSGSGLTYQIVAGPVFNNLYPLAGLFTGFLADYGHRTIWLSIALFLWSAATGLTGFAKAFWHLVVLRALLAIAAAGCNPFAVSIIGDYFPVEFRGSAISIYYFGIYIGYSLAFAIGNGIEGVLNWRWVFFLSAIVGFAIVPFILFTVREPKRTKNVLADKADEQKKLPFGVRVVMLLKTFIMPGMLVLCIAGGVRNAGGYVWAYNTELFFEKSGYSKTHIQSFMSWIPLVAGSIGAVVGGIISDVLVKGRGPYMRIWVLIVSQILAAPFAAGALFLPNPWCFLSLIPSNIIGEMWIGVTTAIVVDLAPSKIRTAALGLYLFIITIIGGNFNLMVEPIRVGFARHMSYLASYRLALLFTFPGVYAISSVLFALAFLLMRLDLKRKSKLEQTMVVNEDSGNGSPEGSEDENEVEQEPRDKPV